MKGLYIYNMLYIIFPVRSVLGAAQVRGDDGTTTLYYILSESFFFAHALCGIGLCSMGSIAGPLVILY